MIVQQTIRTEPSIGAAMLLSLIISSPMLAIAIDHQTAQSLAAFIGTAALYFFIHLFENRKIRKAIRKTNEIDANKKALNQAIDDLHCQFDKKLGELQRQLLAVEQSRDAAISKVDALMAENRSLRTQLDEAMQRIASLEEGARQ